MKNQFFTFFLILLALTSWIRTGYAQPTVTYTAEITPKGTGALGIQVPANVATDAASNGNTASSKSTVNVDADPPTVTISDVPTTTSTTPTNRVFTVKITFNEDVTGFGADDMVFSNSGGTGDTADGTETVGDAGDTDAKTYTAEITPSGTGNLGIQVKADAAKDTANNNNAASNKVSVYV